MERFGTGMVWRDLFLLQLRVEGGVLNILALWSVGIRSIDNAYIRGKS